MEKKKEGFWILPTLPKPRQYGGGDTSASLPQAGHPPDPLVFDATTLREVLGPHPTPSAVSVLQDEVLAALRLIEHEITTGLVVASVCRVRGRPLADYLSLDTVARILQRVPWTLPPPPASAGSPL